MTGGDAPPGRSSVPRPHVGAGVSAVLGSLILSHAAGAQGVTAGLRGGGGIDAGGSAVYAGQIELTDLGSSSSVQLAVAGVGGIHRVEDYEVRHSQRDYAYHEETRVRGVALMANVLLRHSSNASGPYFVLGIGLGPQWVDWRLESVYGRLGNPLPGGGSFLDEEGLTFGTVLNVGIGQRLYRHLDVLAQILPLLVPGNEVREDLKFMPTFLVTTGIAF